MKIFNRKKKDTTTAPVNNSQFELDNELKKLQIKKEFQFVFESEPKRLIIEEQKINLDKIAFIRYAIESVSLDLDNYIIGSEPRWKPTFNDAEITILKSKYFEFLDKL